MRALFICAGTLLVVWVVGIFSGCSTTEHSHQQAESHSVQPGNDHQHTDATHQVEIKIPDKAADVFSEVEKHFQELAAAIQNKDARMAHQHDSAIRTLIASIPIRATPATKADAEALARDIADAARAAHRSAHEDQWAEAADHVKRGQTALANLKASFREMP